MKQKLNHFFSGNKWLPAVCLPVILLLFLTPPLLAQSGEPFAFHDEKLSEILRKISETGALNFSYDANDPVFDRRISYTSKGENVSELLTNILSQAGLEHKQIGKQIVIFKSDRNPVTPVRETARQPEEQARESAIEPPAPLNEIMPDTVFLRDTIMRIDTIRITDTVFVEKEKPQKAPQPKIKELPVDFFQTESIRDKGWAMGVFIAPVTDDFSLVKGQKAFSLRSFSLGLEALKLMKRWNLTLGVRLTQLNHRFSQQYSQSTGGFYDTDTIDAYYTVIDFDTAWYYVTDSSWVPLEVRDYQYERTNTLGYLGFNMSASYDLFSSTDLRVYLKAGGQFDLLIYNKGLAIFGDDQADVTDFDELDIGKINFAISAATGLKYRLADQVDFNAEFYYLRYMNELVTDFPENTRINTMGVKLGLVFYF